MLPTPTSSQNSPIPIVPSQRTRLVPSQRRPPRPGISTFRFLLQSDQSQSATSRRPPPSILHPNLARRYSLPSVPPFVPSIPGTPSRFMTAQWQEPLLADDDYLYTSQDKRALGLETGPEPLWPNPDYGWMNQGYAPQLGEHNPPTYRPALALETAGVQNQQYQPPSSNSSLPSSGFEVDLGSNGGNIFTPGVQWMAGQYQSYPAPSFHPTEHYYNNPDPEWLAAQAAYQYQFPVNPLTSLAPPQQTISPNDLRTSNGNNLLGGHYMEPQESSSSLSSMEPGYEPSSNVLDDWTKPVSQALPYGIGRQRGISSQAAASIPIVTPSFQDPPPTLPDSAPPHDLSSTLRQYIDTPSRLTFGERKIIIMTPKVGQKSYGTEKRFLCPQPQATLIGASWWTKSQDGCPVSPLLPPRVQVSLERDVPGKDAVVSWTAVDGASLNEKMTSQALSADESPLLGSAAGQNLCISLDKNRDHPFVKAAVRITAPNKQHAGQHGWGEAKGTMRDITSTEIIGTFESKDIKVISKPSKSKANKKPGDLIIQHGSTIALFTRIKGQTTKTRYLSVVPDLSRIVGSDGRPALGTGPAKPKKHSEGSSIPGFVTDAHQWESFIIWLVDPNLKPEPSRNPPLHPDWPRAPANASLPSARPIRFNSVVVLQSLQTGYCSPNLIIRRIEQDADAVGGDGRAMDASGPSTAPGEMSGDMVAQLQKVAFEYAIGTHSRGGSGGGYWMSCDEDHVKERNVESERRWSVPPLTKSRPSSVPSTPNQRISVLPMTPHTSHTNLPSLESSPLSSHSSMDHAGLHSHKGSSASLFSPSRDAVPLPLPSTDGGPVRRQRTGSTGMNPLARPAPRKQRSGDISAHASMEHLPAAAQMEDSGRRYWTLDVGEDCVWSIVGTEQISYTFMVPQYVTRVTEPYAPFPSVGKILAPGLAGDAGHRSAKGGPWTTTSSAPLVTIYGKNFVKQEENKAHHVVYYGDQPASFNEVRCNEVMAAAEPLSPLVQPVPVFLVREDGQCIIPTGLSYP